MLKAKSGKVLLRPGEAGEFNKLNNPGASPSLTATRASDETTGWYWGAEEGTPRSLDSGIGFLRLGIQCHGRTDTLTFQKNIMMLKSETAELLVPCSTETVKKGQQILRFSQFSDS